jgi:hypothetical protein
MTRVIDLTGQRFGRWTALTRTTKQKWLCRCDCSFEREIFIGNLRPILKTQSCGCWGWSKSTRRINATKHGHYGSPAYRSWQAMKRRLKTRAEYADIGMDPSWRAFSNFIRDMGERPVGFSLERIDNAGSYCKANCKWIPEGDQAKNTRRQIWFSYAGQRMIISDWCRVQSLPDSRVRARIRRGWPIAQALELEPRTLLVQDHR